MPSSNDRERPGAGPSDDLRGLDILLVEDSVDVGEALKAFLELLGASVAGPAATTAEAERLVIERLPDVALVDFHLRGGEQSYGLIARLYEQGVRRHHAFGLFRVSATVIGSGRGHTGEAFQ